MTIESSRVKAPGPGIGPMAPRPKMSNLTVDKETQDSRLPPTLGCRCSHTIVYVACHMSLAGVAHFVNFLACCTSSSCLLARLVLLCRSIAPLGDAMPCVCVVGHVTKRNCCCVNVFNSFAHSRCCRALSNSARANLDSRV